MNKKLLIILSLILIFLLNTGCSLQKKVRKSKALLELSYVKDKIHNYHPNPNYFKTNNYTDSVYNLVYEQLLSKNRISKYQLVSNIEKYSASFNDGHLRINFSILQEIFHLIKGKFFPFEIKISNNSIYISYNYSEEKEIKEGYEIHSINGVLSPSILQKLRSRTAANNNKFKDLYISSGFPYKNWRYGGNETTYLIKFISPEGDTITKSIEGISYTKYNKESYKKYRRDDKKTFELGAGQFVLPLEWVNKKKRLPKYYCYINDSISYIKLRSFTGEKNQNDFYKNCFKTIQQSKSTILFIDIRNNLGGRTTNFEQLFSYLSDDTIHQAYKVNYRLNKEALKLAKQKSKKGDSLFYNKIKSHSIGDTFTLLTKNELTLFSPNNPLLFLGKIYVITNAKTFSAASAFATIIKNNKIGLVIGEETGGMTNAFGDPVNLKLPISKSYISVPTKQIFQADSLTKKSLTPNKYVYIKKEFEKDPDGTLEELIRSITTK